jgi:hypothetical protein
LSQEGLRAMLALRAQVGAAAVPPPLAALFHLRLASLGNNGRLPAAEVADAEARAQQAFRALGARRRLFATLYLAGWTANMAGDAAGAQATLDAMAALEDPAWPAWLRSERLNLLAAVHNAGRRFDAAAAVARAQMALLEGVAGEQALLATAQANLCRDLVCLGRDDEALELAAGVIEQHRGDREASIGYVRRHLMTAQLCLGRVADAAATLQQALPGWQRDGLLASSLDVMAQLCAEQGRWADAARLLGAADAFLRRSGVGRPPVLERARERAERRLGAAGAAGDDVAQWRREGAQLDERRLVALCLACAGGG